MELKLFWCLYLGSDTQNEFFSVGLGESKRPPLFVNVLSHRIIVQGLLEHEPAPRQRDAVGDAISRRLELRFVITSRYVTKGPRQWQARMHNSALYARSRSRTSLPSLIAAVTAYLFS